MKTRAEVIKLAEQIFAECQVTLKAAQKEYAHDEQNALLNFERVACELNIPREKVWYTYAAKHWLGIQAWINGHRSQREDVRGRIKDLMVYSMLLWAMVEDEAQLPIKEKAVEADDKKWVLFNSTGHENIYYGPFESEQAAIQAIQTFLDEVKTYYLTHGTTMELEVDGTHGTWHLTDGDRRYVEIELIDRPTAAALSPEKFHLKAYQMIVSK